MSRDEAHELRRRPEPVLPDPDAEAEVDLRRYGSALAARWWLPLLGLLAGLVVGYALSLGGRDVYRAEALVYLGVPLAPGGDAQVQGPGANPAFLRETVVSEGVVRRVASEVGMRPSELRGGIFMRPVAAGKTARPTQQTLVNVGVVGDGPGRVAAAANTLARLVVARLDDYAISKIAGLETQLRQTRAELAAVDAQLESARRALRQGGLGTSDRLVLLTLAAQNQQRRSVIQQGMLERQALLSLARDVERPRVLERAVARKTTAQSRRNSVIVAGALGLLAGLAAALAWESLARRLPARAA